MVNPETQSSNPNPDFRSRDWEAGIRDFLESRSEPELHRPRLERDVRVVLRRSVVAGSLIGDKGVVVRVVEHVEHFGDAVDRHPVAQLEALLDARVDAMQVRAIEAVPLDERSVRQQPIGGPGDAVVRPDDAGGR